MKRWKPILILLSILLISSILFSCAASSSDTASQNSAISPGYAEESKDVAMGAPVPEPNPVIEKYGSEAGTNLPDTQPLANRKMIWNGSLEIEATDYDAAMEALYALIEETGSYVQSSSVTGEGRLNSGQQRLRNARLTVRVPTENFTLFIQSSGEVATLLQSTTNAQDISDSYFDTEARLKVLRVKEDRLLEMLKMTSDKEYASQLQYILQIETELTNVRYEIESLTGTLRRYDNLVSYSTLEVYLSEVEVLTATPATPATVGERIASRFSASLKMLRENAERFIVWFIGYSPILILTAVLLTVPALIVRRANRRKAQKKSDKPSDNPPPPAQ